MTTHITAQRNYATGIELTLGLVSAAVDVVPVRNPQPTAERNHYVCTDCDPPSFLRMSYVCPEGHAWGGERPPARGREVDGRLVILDPEEMEALRAEELPTGLLELNVCPTGELEASTRPGEQAYRVRTPRRATAKFNQTYALLRELARSEQYALYGVAKFNNRSLPTPYRLVVWHDQLVLQSLIRPQDIAEVDEIDATCPDKYVMMGQAFMEQSVAPFDPDLLENRRKHNVDALIQSKLDDAPILSSKETTELSLEEALEAALAAVA